MSSMTKQEAIEILTEMRDWNDYITQSDALQMAIDELEKKPAANSEDAISRQAVLDAMATWDWQELYLPIHFKQLLENLPSVSCSEKPNRCGDAISRQAAMDGLGKYHDGADLHIDGLTYAYDLVCKLPSVSTEKTGRCKDCKYFEYDSFEKINGMQLIVAHEICSKWADGCKTREDGYCFLFEPKTQEVE